MSFYRGVYRLGKMKFQLSIPGWNFNPGWNSQYNQSLNTLIRQAKHRNQIEAKENWISEKKICRRVDLFRRMPFYLICLNQHLPVWGNNVNIKRMYQICSKLTQKTPQRRQWHRYGDFIVNFEQISHPALYFYVLNPVTSSFVSIADFEQAHADCGKTYLKNLNYRCFRFFRL